MSLASLGFFDFISPYDWNSPNIGTYLRLATERQTASSGYPLMFFADTKTPSKMYLISGWEDIEAHNKYVAGEGVHELMKMFGPYLKMQGVAHLAVKFRDIPPQLDLLRIEKVEPNQEAFSGGGWSVVGKAVDIEGVAYRLTESQGDIRSGEVVGRRVKVEGLPE